MKTRHWIAAIGAAALTACGGGGTDDAPGSALGTDEAQGYAADAGTMPVSAATGAEAAVGALESALGTGTTAADRSLPQAVQPQAGGAAQCQRGGSIAWQVTGGSGLHNGQLDAGETYSVSFDGCVTGDGGPTIDGDLSLTVTARSVGSLAYTLTASALNFTQGSIRYVLDGTLSEARTSLTDVTGTQVTGQLSSPGLRLESTIGTRKASYQLNTLAWTVVRTYNVSGILVSRSHQGTLELSASTPRRPNASLAISTVGSTQVGSDGFISSGTYTVKTARDTIRSEHGGGTVTLTLDRGSDGTIDRTWTLTRAQFIDAAG